MSHELTPEVRAQLEAWDNLFDRKSPARRNAVESFLSSEFGTKMHEEVFRKSIGDSVLMDGSKTYYSIEPTGDREIDILSLVVGQFGSMEEETRRRMAQYINERFNPEVKVMVEDKRERLAW